MNCRWLVLIALVFTCLIEALCASPTPGGSRFTYLHGSDPFYVGRDFPKLTTPQWIGEEGVEAVVILSIDDMRDNEPKYESMLRPTLERLKQIDGRAPVSIMVNTLNPTNAQLQDWLKEGLSLECHTVAHPCPLCQRSNFVAAASTYHDCVDLLSSVPGNHPVAFRMPCCDSMNSPTPRFYSEIFNRTARSGRFLTIDSSVMVILTTNDPALPRSLVLDANGRDRFRKYLPSETTATTRVSMGSFTTTIEDYPYPYVIGNKCWEFPCIVPSDWEGHNLHGSTNAVTVEDWTRALDAVVLKQGVMTIVFHPHGWISSGQMTAFVDYAERTYGKRVKFLTFKEAQERIDKNLLAGTSIRSRDGGDNGVRLADLNNDGLMDVISAPRDVDGQTRIWNAAAKRWVTAGFPVPLQSGAGEQVQASFGVPVKGGGATLVWVARSRATNRLAAFQFSGSKWESLPSTFTDLPDLQERAPTLAHGYAFEFRDVDRDGADELIVSAGEFSRIYKRDDAKNTWSKLPYGLPSRTTLADEHFQDAGLRFVDVNGDGYEDVLFSNAERYSLHLFRSDDRKLRLKPGWTDEVLAGARVDPLTDPIPPIVRAGTNRNNGVWFSRGTMWIQNEDTAHLPDKVDRRTFKRLLSGYTPPALSPEQAVKTIQVHPGFIVELVASEPQIMDPIGFQWSADGRLWVVEMGDYPAGVDGHGKPGGRIRVLEDADGDGRYERASTFLEGLNFPTGIHPWRKGAVVSAAPDIFYAEDTDGDGKADVREVLFSGFVEGNQQHRVNGFDYGLDGWLYAANGDSGGTIRPVGSSALAGRTLDISGRDLRIHPDRRAVESVAGQTQYGRHRDDWGNWFGNNNPTWLWHYFFPEEYLVRNPLLPVSSLKKVLANYPGSTRCYPASRTLSRFNDPHAFNHVTSASSAAPYRDDLFGKPFENAVFICDSVHNLVHCEVLVPDGVTFTSGRLASETNSEFVASTDNWFRPVFARTGPDGALYIADMYRFVIEHPEWIPPEMQERLDLRAGADKGRIYRVFPQGAKLAPVPNLAAGSTAELVETLNSSNGWQRDTAQRLLIERQERRAAPAAARLAQTAASSKTRVQALWTLAGLDALGSEVLIDAMRHQDAQVREHAIRLSELLLGRTSAPALVNALLELVADPAPRVRFQLAFTLGECRDDRAVPALVTLAGDSNRHVQQAALSSAAPHVKGMISVLEKDGGNNSARAHLTLLRKLERSGGRTVDSPVFIKSTNNPSASHRADRAKAVAQFSDLTRLQPNLQNGRALFEQNCAQCHRLRGLGAEVGPDLDMMSGKPAEQVVVAVIDPNAAVQDRYRAYTVVTRVGDELTGIVVAETPTTMTLRMPNHPDQVLLRADLREVTVSSVSLMPDGLEAGLTPQQMADLVSFVQGK